MGVLSASGRARICERRRLTLADRFPEGFLWGTASAAHQVEGDNRNCDWWEFEQQPGRIAGGDTSEISCDHYHRYREDFSLLREMNQNAHRLSIEWSRIEPSEGEFDSRQIRHYRDVLGELREQGIQPMVTLHHFSSPLWFTRKGGWTAAGSAPVLRLQPHACARDALARSGPGTQAQCRYPQPASVAGDSCPGLLEV